MNVRGWFEKLHFFSLHNSNIASYKEKWCRVCVPFFIEKSPKSLLIRGLVFLCGEIGIRTRDTILSYTRFPGVPLKPLEHLSRNEWNGNYFPSSITTSLFSSRRRSFSPSAFTVATLPMASRTFLSAFMFSSGPAIMVVAMLPKVKSLPSRV